MKEYLEAENFNWSCRTHRVRKFVIIICRVSMEVKCGGVVVKHQKMLQDANFQNMRAKMMRRMIRIKMMMKKIGDQKRLSVSVAKNKVIVLNNVLEIQI